MEFFNDCIAVGVDLILLGFCVHEFVRSKRATQALKAAKQYKIDDTLKSLVEKQPGKKISYALIRGVVTPIGVPLESSLVPRVNGVLQIIRLYEHKIAKGISGFWQQKHQLLQESANEMPFELRNQEHSVQIVDALKASILDVDTVYDNFEPSSLSIFDYICGFFSGVRQKGLQTTEEVLKEGSFLTAIGELKLDGDTLRMQTSQEGPLVLTTASKSMLIKRLEDAHRSLIFKLVVCSAISLVLVAFVARKIYRRSKRKMEEASIHNRLETQRKRDPSVHLPQDQLCVVCASNPKEIILFPCGHVCLCEGCAQKISISCPVCRCKIASKAAAFIG
ncbi:mitochondrial E3 ubiquitin protein ligase 1-like [Drosophila eugracilis]|uniref:mitochondrial E3 ubiquitin protein ligase 1-like n=1 Tax=Drosophila eugracilis TaxID=29029 RepID=UPI0007E79D7D|nr:mitochondrial E3 ubiquitin protein ligase 1-like [Drosophila eugracilis]